MIKRLYIDNMFRHFDRTFEFEKGLTAIIGPNESGKSLIVEAIRYALFGSKALRGLGDDYKKLHVELDFVVAGEDYTVVRKGSKVTLQGDVVNVTGTKPVDAAIQKILGYDLSVFDVANACNQGNVEALSNMQPAARKTMVDQTVGLNVLDNLISHTGTEGNALKREAAALSSGLVEPSPPVEPENYRESSKILIPLDDQREYHQLVGFLSGVPREPTHPGEAPEVSAADLKSHQAHRVLLSDSIKNLQAQLKNIEPEDLDEAEIATWEQHHDHYDAWMQKQRLLAQGTLTCPSCEHEYPVADLGDLEDVREIAAPRLTRRDLAASQARIGNNDKIKSTELNIAALTKELEGMEDMSTALAIAEAYEARDAIYGSQMAAWNEYNKELPGKKLRHAELEGVDATVAALQVELQAAQQYERDLNRYTGDKARWTEQAALVTRLQVRSDEFLKAREIIQALKVSVKSHLLPSLNKVASLLLSQMTGGERTTVEVDEDFEILIDDQRINTLSGSGKAVANLAIRIALGQILTNRVFSLFMADEVDASMDDERADHTADALRRLKEHVQQVILVTHKRPETDQTFELSK